jgi:serine/threonine-protein kinase RsbT
LTEGVPGTLAIAVVGESDIAEAARQARTMALVVGFAKVPAHYIATAASELAANLWIHAGGGVLEVRSLAARPGLELVATDRGPGIADVALAMREGYSTAGGLGCGLSGVQRLMDELEIDTQPGRGTVVQARKWL